MSALEIRVEVGEDATFFLRSRRVGGRRRRREDHRRHVVADRQPRAFLIEPYGLGGVTLPQRRRDLHRVGGVADAELAPQEIVDQSRSGDQRCCRSVGAVHDALCSWLRPPYATALMSPPVRRVIVGAASRQACQHRSCDGPRLSHAPLECIPAGAHREARRQVGRQAAAADLGGGTLDRLLVDGGERHHVDERSLRQPAARLVGDLVHDVRDDADRRRDELRWHASTWNVPGIERSPDPLNPPRLTVESHAAQHVRLDEHPQVRCRMHAERPERQHPRRGIREEVLHRSSRCRTAEQNRDEIREDFLVPSGPYPREPGVA